jgi:predicted RND superfamily exporter protein
VVVKGKEKNAIRDLNSLATMEELSYFIRTQVENAGGTLSIVDLVTRVGRMFHDGAPKWEIVPKDKRGLGNVVFIVEGNMGPGEMDTYVDSSFTHSNVTAFIRDYTNDSIKAAIAKIKEFGDQVNNDKDSKVEIKLAGGILGIVAAVNEEVGWSYWAILVTIFVVIFITCWVTYGNYKSALILVMPVYVSQVLCEFLMMGLNIDINIDSLPVASVGVGVGIDYGMYLLSRIKDECEKGVDFDDAKNIALETTGKIIMFTALTLAMGLIFWVFSTLKFQAEMGFLLLCLMVFNMIGALIFVPCLCSDFRPHFMKKKLVTA